MRTALRLFLLELKKNLKMLPFVILAAAAAAVFLSLFLSLLSNSLYKEEPLARATVAIVTSDAENDLMKKAIQFIGNMSSTSLALDFEVMEAEKAASALRKHDVIAVMLFPDDLINGILYGNNVPIEVRFSDTDALSSVFLSELTRSGAKLLSSAQADTYAATELYYSLGRQDALNEAYNDIDLMNFSFVLSREKLFAVTDTLPVFLSYIASAALLFLLFSSSAFAPALKMEDRSFYDLLFSGHFPAAAYLLIRLLANWLITFLFTALCYTALLQIPELPFEIAPKTDAASFFCLFLVSGIISALALFLHQATASAPLSILLQLTLSVVMLFLSGGILPSAFLPAGIRAAGAVLPTTPLCENLLVLLSGRDGYRFSPAAVWIPVLFILACIAFQIRKEGKRF